MHTPPTPGATSETPSPPTSERRRSRVSFAMHERVAGVGTRVVVARGEMGLVESRALEALVLRSVRHGARRFVFDFDHVTTLRPGLVGALVRILRGLRALDGGIAIVAVRGPVKKVLHLAAFDEFLPLAASHREALAALAAPSPA